MPSTLSSQFLRRLTTTLSVVEVDQEFRLDLLDKTSRVFLVGNGGSAAVAAHIANDLVKAGWSAFSLTEPAVLTCLSNDYSYGEVYAQQLKAHFRVDDCLIAISSSGRSPSILNAVEEVQEFTDKIVTLSGFSPDNPLRQLGCFNYYVSSSNYGLVEIAHLAILHAIAKPE